FFDKLSVHANFPPMVWFGHLYHTGNFAFFLPSIFSMHTDLQLSSTTCGEEPISILSFFS
ncbi:hypothetical protein, partial [Geobacillus stearothermophilus]|uniref:hypothetical protein n=1 Tax=Geobacillus stearothermophilus TaxID=1422 RepID=UPI001C7D2084